MGLFGFGKEPEPEPERKVPSALDAARGEYEALRRSFPESYLVLQSIGGNRAFAGQRYYFACTEREVLFLEEPNTDDLTPERYRACRVKRFPRENTVITKPRAAVASDRQEGVLRHYPTAPLTLVFTQERFGEARFQLANTSANLRYLSEHLPECAPLPLFDLFDKPEKIYAVSCKKGDGVLTDGTPLELWREGEQLKLTRRRVDYYGLESGFWYGEIPLQDIVCFRGAGQIEYETKISGGGVSIDRDGAMWGGLFGFNSNANMLENAIVSEPIRTERIEHDNRFAELSVRYAGKTAEMQFGYSALEAFEALIPEKAAQHQAQATREPTVAEQIEILANVCERGYLTREEFEGAKRKLLDKL